MPACLPAFNKHNQKLKVTSSFGLEREREGGREAMREQGEREGAAAMLRSSEFQWSRRLFAATAMLNPSIPAIAGLAWKQRRL